jgi:hypothetical protein
MGKTVESYRMALESEISRWSDFAKALRRRKRIVGDDFQKSPPENYASRLQRLRYLGNNQGLFCLPLVSQSFYANRHSFGLTN